MAEVRVKSGTALFGVAAAALTLLVCAFGCFAVWVLLQYGSKSTEFEWQAQRLGEQWYVSYVVPEGNADGSLVNGDLLVAINGERTGNVASLGPMLRSVAGASLYCVRVQRAGKETEVWLRAQVRSKENFFTERLPLMAASAFFFLAALTMLARWNSPAARIGAIAALASSLRMGAWAMLPVAGFFRPWELHAYFLFWLPVGLALPATLHALLRFTDDEEPGRAWWAVCASVYLLWGTGGLTLPLSGSVPAAVPDGIAYVFWDHVGYSPASAFVTLGFPLLLLASLAACAIRLVQLLSLHPEGDINRRLHWLLTGGILFALPMLLCEAAKWLGLEYQLASSWLSSLTAISASYALATDSVSAPSVVVRGVAGAILPSRWFGRLDQRYFPQLFAAENTLRTALDRLRRITLDEDWRAVVSGAIETAFHPVTFRITGSLAPGELIEIGGKRSGEPYTRRERILVDRIEDALLTLMQGQRKPAEAAARPAPEAINLLRECPKCGACYGDDAVRCSADGQIPALTLPVERVVDSKYRLDRLLGRGGMGSVYSARDLRLDRKVAVKIMLSDLFGHPGAVKRFEREARLAAKISHANVIQIFDFGPVGTMGAYQVMELVEGRTWRQEIHTAGRVPISDCLPWVEQLLDGVQAAHEAGVIHRDLKPDNLLLVDRDGAPPLVKILDFGLAKMNLLDLSREEKLSIGITTIGTVGYVPPEQLTGGIADQRSDVYAVGRILIETLTGSLPSEGGAVLDNPLRDVLNRCTALAPSQRHESVAALRSELLPALHAVSAEAAAPV